ncbi:MAG: hypothetical protein HRU20_00140 [Pseudomonadales bacterium]|nr:hypothetical protein [Pseudomonadales bacterium]
MNINLVKLIKKITLGTILIFSATLVWADYYAVTVTNISKGSLFTPLFFATHKAGPTFFALGDTASDELAMLAEGGATGPLADALIATGKVKDTAFTEDVLMPGASVTVKLKAGHHAKYLSMASMILPSNDGFIALQSVKLPKGRKGKTFYSPVYDSGSEENNELCSSIPGPCGGEGYSSDDGEGYIHIHSGIHGVGDLSTADHDWRHVIAKITVKRVWRNDDDDD